MVGLRLLAAAEREYMTQVRGNGAQESGHHRKTGSSVLEECVHVDSHRLPVPRVSPMHAGKGPLSRRQRRCSERERGKRAEGYRGNLSLVLKTWDHKEMFRC